MSYDSDSYSEVTYTSWFSRVTESIKGVSFGVLLIAGSIYGLWWNEGNSVKTIRGLAELSDAALSVSSDTIDAAHEAGVVHVTGATKTQTPLRDETFGLEINALKLKRTVEMYQWYEKKKTSTRKDLGGGTTKKTTYRYAKQWSESAVDSERFHKSQARRDKKNPAFRYSSKTLVAQTARLGAFTLATEFLRSFDVFEELAPPPVLPETFKDAARSEESVYIGADSASPRVGDMRITFTAVKNQEVSVIAKQRGAELTSYLASNGKVFTVIQAGNKSVDLIFAAEASTNQVFTWIVRGVGSLVIFFGFLMIFSPLVVVADIIPFVGGLLGAGAFLISVAFAFITSASVIAVAWFFYRPVVSLGLLAAVAAVLFWMKGRGENASARAPESV